MSIFPPTGMRTRTQERMLRLYHHPLRESLCDAWMREIEARVGSEPSEGAFSVLGSHVCFLLPMSHQWRGMEEALARVARRVLGSNEPRASDFLIDVL